VRWPWVVAALGLVGCSTDLVLPAGDALDVRLDVHTPVVREGETLEAELVVTNHGKLPVWLAGARCPSQMWVRDDRGNATGQVMACAAAIFGDDHWLDSGETTAFPRFWSSRGAWAGQYFAVGYLPLPGGSILYSDTVAISVEPASP
jgi:hypothetical protein